VGAYGRQLLHCGDGMIDPGEQCGEPGLTCADSCTTCSSCVCALNQPVCGDGVVCGSEQCESDADCGTGQVCRGCQCINTPACESGIVMQRASLKVRSAPFSLRLTGRAIIPKPWQAVDPLVNGVRIAVDAVTGPGGVTAVIPGGALSAGVGWTLNRSGNRWTFIDPDGSHAGVTRVVIRDLSQTTDGLILWHVRATGGTVALPDVHRVRTAMVVGDALECAAIQWNPPGAPRPRCAADATRLSCR
jgi:hypothetical protein